VRGRADSEENSWNRSFHNFFPINELVHHIGYVIEVIPPSEHSQKKIPPSACPLRPVFSAGPNGESHALFGVLAPVAEPSTYAMMLLGLGLRIRRPVLRLEDSIERG
jgi:hypothetical protein